MSRDISRDNLTLKQCTQQHIYSGTMQQVEELVQGVYDLLMKAYPANSQESLSPYYVTDDDTLAGLTSGQLISLSLKAPGLLLMPMRTMKRERDSDIENVVKRPRPSPGPSGTCRGTIPLESLQCKECLDVFPTTGLLLKHVNMVHQSPHRSFSPQQVHSPHIASRSSPCITPPVLTGVPQEVLEYRQRPEFRRCMLCSVMFGSNEQLSAHLTSAHRNQKTYNCIALTSCPMVFTDIRSLKTHVYEVHIRECPVCKQRFSEPSLAQHIILAHHSDNLPGCPICNIQYTDCEGLVVHLRTQHDICSRTDSMTRERHRTDSTLTVKSETVSIESP